MLCRCDQSIKDITSAGKDTCSITQRDPNLQWSLFKHDRFHIGIYLRGEISLSQSKEETSLREDAFVRDARKQLTWKALFVARWQKCGGRRDGRCSIPGGYDIRLHPVTRRKLQNLLLLLAASPSTSARRERLHGRQKADPAHVFPPRFRFRAEMACANRTSDQFYARLLAPGRQAGRSGPDSVYSVKIAWRKWPMNYPLINRSIR